ncbi:hypothetical protein [Qaidamihabitans albus]|uniref:hypothetical protein n=1 Tax=Qaidamihabitans albus TaxID=2795733 RepID=UPI0018F1C40E|nr:hypothetical protein [Qaidamihabitans albus]
MTDESRGRGGVVGPPWSVDVLADLHAGVLDESEAAELWPRVNADPEARAIIDALEATTADLSLLGTQPAEPVPADVAARIDAALAEEQAPSGGNVVSLDAARRRRNRRLGWGAGLLTAAAAVVAGLVLGVPAQDSVPGVAQPPAAVPSEAPLALSGDNLDAAIGAVDRVRDFGPLGDQDRLDACLTASGVDIDRRPIGVRPVTIDGREAVVALYTTGELAQFRLVAVAPDCGPDNPGLLRDEVVGREGG